MVIKIGIVATEERVDERIDFGDKPKFNELAMALATMKKIEQEIIDIITDIEPEYEVSR